MGMVAHFYTEQLKNQEVHINRLTEQITNLRQPPAAPTLAESCSATSVSHIDLQVQLVEVAWSNHRCVADFGLQMLLGTALGELGATSSSNTLPDTAVSSWPAADGKCLHLLVADGVFRSVPGECVPSFAVFCAAGRIQPTPEAYSHTPSPRISPAKGCQNPEEGLGAECLVRSEAKLHQFILGST